MKKYLLAVDGSENSRRAALYALNPLRESGSPEVTIMHVVNIRKDLLNFSLLMDIGDIEEKVMERGREILDEQAIIFEKEGLSVKKIIADGDPGHKIAEYGGEGGFDQIILGTRGLSDLKGLVLGSVSHKVIHLARCPVTLIK